MSDISHPYSARLGFGQFGQIEARLEPVLAALALSALVFIPMLGALATLVFLAFGLVLCVLRPGQLILKALRHWPVTLLPLLCILSFTWSREPGMSLRFGLQLMATALVTLAICRHLSPRAFVLTLFTCMLVSMLISLGLGDVRSDTGARIGIYGSKNAFAGAASVFTIIAFGIALMRGNGWPLRSFGLFSTIIGAALVVSAQSASATIFLAPTLLAIVVAMKIHRLGILPAWSVAIFLCLAAILAGLALHANWYAVSAFVLEATGKDLTLTGRTDLWSAALALIGERPFTGVGYQAFWVQGHGDAEALWFMFGIESRSGFNFHNMYLSNAVEIGIPGMLLQAAILFGTAILTGIWAIRSGNAVPATLFALTFVTILGSAVEVPLFFQFSLRTVVVLAALIYAREVLSHRHARTDRSGM